MTSDKPSLSSIPSSSLMNEVLDVKDEKGVIEAIANYEIDLIVRIGYFLDKLMNAIEEKHTTEGGYRENLLKKRLLYKKNYS